MLINLKRNRVTGLKIFPLLIVLLEVIAYLSNDMYLPTLPRIAVELHATHHLMQLTLTTWFIGTACLQLAAGPLSDHFGRKPIVLIGALIFILTTVLCAVAYTPACFIGARFFQGCSVCLIAVPGYSAIHELFDQLEAIRLLAWMGCIVIVAPAVGPILGSLIMHVADWRCIFWLLAVGAIILSLLLLIWMPESNPHQSKRAFSMSALFKNYYSVLKNKNFCIYTLISGCIFGGIIAWITVAAFLSMVIFHYSSLEFGFFQLIVFGGFIIGTYLVKRILHSVRMTRLISYGLFIAVLGALLSVITSKLLATEFLPFIIAVSLYATGGGLALSSLQRAAVDASKAPMGIKIALFSTGMAWFGVFGSIVATMPYHGTRFMLGSLLLGAAATANFLWLTR